VNTELATIAVKRGETNTNKRVVIDRPNDCEIQHKPGAEVMPLELF